MTATRRDETSSGKESGPETSDGSGSTPNTSPLRTACSVNPAYYSGSTSASGSTQPLPHGAGSGGSSEDSKDGKDSPSDGSSGEEEKVCKDHPDGTSPAPVHSKAVFPARPVPLTLRGAPGGLRKPDFHMDGQMDEQTRV